MLQPEDMQGRAALVTGAASGLGRATAIVLARAGADLAIVDINAAGLDETAKEIRDAGARALVLARDIAEASTCREIVAEAVAAYGRLDALCNVAAVLTFAHSTEMTEAQWRRLIDVNLSAPFFLMQAAIPQILEREGAIVNVTSQAAFLPQAYSTAYSASKAALTMLTRAWAMEYMHKPIRINAVAPGGMATNIMSGTAFPDGADMSLIQRYMGLRGVLDTEEIARMVAYLASPAAKAFHGACVNIDGGASVG